MRFNVTAQAGKGRWNDPDSLRTKLLDLRAAPGKVRAVDDPPPPTPPISAAQAMGDEDGESSPLTDPELEAIYAAQLALGLEPDPDSKSIFLKIIDVIG